jgi:hypothetical protein
MYALLLLLLLLLLQPLGWQGHGQQATAKAACHVQHDRVLHLPLHSLQRGCVCCLPHAPPLALPQS